MAANAAGILHKPLRPFGLVSLALALCRSTCDGLCVGRPGRLSLFSPTFPSFQPGRDMTVATRDIDLGAFGTKELLSAGMQGHLGTSC